MPLMPRSHLVFAGAAALAACGAEVPTATAAPDAAKDPGGKPDDQAPSGPQIPEAFRGAWDSWGQCEAGSGGIIRVGAREVTYSDSSTTITSVKRKSASTIELSGVSSDPSVGNEAFGYVLDDGGKRMWWHGADHSPIRLDRCTNLDEGNAGE